MPEETVTLVQRIRPTPARRRQPLTARSPCSAPTTSPRCRIPTRRLSKFAEVARTTMPTALVRPRRRPRRVPQVLRPGPGRRRHRSRRDVQRAPRDHEQHGCRHAAVDGHRSPRNPQRPHPGPGQPGGQPAGPRAGSDRDGHDRRRERRPSRLWVRAGRVLRDVGDERPADRHEATPVRGHRPHRQGMDVA